MKFSSGHYGLCPWQPRLREGDEYANLNVLFDDVTIYLQTHCYNKIEAKIFRVVRACMPSYWEVFVPPPLTPHNQFNRLPCLHEAIVIGQRFAVNKSDVQDNKLLFESAMVAIRYILEISRIRFGLVTLGLLSIENYPMADFFTNYDQVKQCYTKKPFYDEDSGLAFKKPRFPEGETGLDERERTELTIFANLMRITLPLILNLKSKRKPVTHIIEALVGGQERKIQSGSGVTDFSRRRFTIFEDESGIMPITNNRQSKKISTDDVVAILNDEDDIHESLERQAFKIGLNNAMNENFTHYKKFPNGLEINSNEISSVNGRSVLTSTQISKGGEIIAQNVKYMADYQDILEFDMDDGFPSFSPRSQSLEVKSIDDFMGSSFSSSSASASSNAAFHDPSLQFVEDQAKKSSSSSSMGGGSSSYSETGRLLSFDGVPSVGNSNSNNFPVREVSLRTFLTNDSILELDDFDAFSYDFSDSFVFPDDKQIDTFKSENKDIKIESQIVKEGENNIALRGVSFTRLKSNDAWKLIQSDPEVMEHLTGLMRQTSDSSSGVPGRSVSRLVSLNKPISSQGWTRSISNRGLSSGSNVSLGHVFDSNNVAGGGGRVESISPSSSGTGSALTKRPERDDDSFAHGNGHFKKNNSDLTDRFSYDDLNQ